MHLCNVVSAHENPVRLNIKKYLDEKDAGCLSSCLLCLLPLAQAPLKVQPLQLYSSVGNFTNQFYQASLNSHTEEVSSLHPHLVS